MTKSIYSLVLDDELVSLIDRAAMRSGRSRSAVIGDILAREFGYETAQMRVQNMLGFVRQQLTELEEFGAIMQDSSLMFRSALPFRYNPTVSYELDAENGSYTLRITVRGRSESFVTTYESFINAWLENEKEQGRAEFCSYSDGRFIRRLDGTSDGGAQTGRAVSAYIQTFDNAMKSFFRSGGGEEGKKAVASLYSEYITQYGKILL